MTDVTPGISKRKKSLGAEAIVQPTTIRHVPRVVPDALGRGARSVSETKRAMPLRPKDQKFVEVQKRPDDSGDLTVCPACQDPAVRYCIDGAMFCRSCGVQKVQGITEKIKRQREAPYRVAEPKAPPG